MNTLMAPDSLNNPLWQYSLQIYQCEEVQRLCLLLQDELGGNVNILLWACWLEHHHKALMPELLVRAVDELSAWEAQIVKPLRQIRREMKSLMRVEALQPELESKRQQIKQIELHAEQQEQAWLYRLSLDAPLGENDNVGAYCDFLDAGGDEWLHQWRCVMM